MINILSLDLGTKTGFHVKNFEHESYGLISLAKYKSHPEKFIMFYNSIRKLIDDNVIDVIAYEEVKRFMSSASAHLYGGFRAILLMVAYSRDCEVYGLSPTEIKKSFTGSGKAKKDDMIAKCLELKYAVDDDNVADAIAIYHTYKELVNDK